MGRMNSTTLGIQIFVSITLLALAIFSFVHGKLFGVVLFGVGLVLNTFFMLAASRGRHR